MGAVGVEYAALLALIAVVVALGAAALGVQAGDAYRDACSRLPAVGGSTPGGHGGGISTAPGLRRCR